MTVHFIYTDYDDSLSFSNLNLSSDIIILWLDFSRYQIENIYEFIEQRLYYLRSIFKKNILIIPLNGKNHDFSISGVYNLDLQYIRQEFGEKFFDERLEPFSGTKLSGLSLMKISKILALRYLPALLKPVVKAIIVDFDNTLYQGVLGEDGIDKIVLTKYHAKLQNFLFELSQKGVLICGISKNNVDDVKKMFEKRTDFPLNWDVFSKVLISWELKSYAVQEIKDYLNINEDSMLFIDDNIGEIIEVMSVFPNIKIIHASVDAEITYAVLQDFPGIFRFASQPEDNLRKDDIKANEKRTEIQQLLSHETYIKSLNMILTYKINNKENIPRIVELSNKTNQFIFSYKRYSLMEISEYMESKTTIVVSIFLRDKLSDSGLIGSCIIKMIEKTAFLEDLFISCRALGRGIEEIIILNAIKTALDRLNVFMLKVNFVKGERNKPAELFVNKYMTCYLNNAVAFSYQNNTNLLEVNFEE
jgi:FkbH-like protein